VASALVIGPPKTAAGVRTIAIPEAIVADLRAALAQHAEPGPDGRVFTGPKGATIRRSNWHAIWRRACVTAGVGPRRAHLSARNERDQAIAASVDDLVRRHRYAGNGAASGT